MQTHLRRYGRFILTLYARFFADGCTYRAAALTYTSLLSLVPLMTVSFAIFAAFPVFKQVSQQIQNFIFAHFLVDSGTVIQAYLQKFVAQTAHLSVIGLFFLVVTAVLMMFTMEQALNAIWRVKSRHKGLSMFLLYWAILTFTPILIGLSIIVSTYVWSLPAISAATQSLGLAKPLIAIFPFLLSVFAFALIYIAVPNCYVPIKYGLVGGVVAGILFALAKMGFTYYVTHFPTYTLLYGALATIPFFLLWLYIFWVIILFGAILTNVLSTGYSYRSSQKMDAFTHTFRWLGYFWQAFQQGKNLSLHDLTGMDSMNYSIHPEAQIQAMLNAGLIQEASANNYVLSQNLANFTLLDLYKALPWRLPSVQELEHWSGQWEQNLAQIIQTIEADNAAKIKVPLAQMYREG